MTAIASAPSGLGLWFLISLMRFPFSNFGQIAVGATLFAQLAISPSHREWSPSALIQTAA